MNIFTFDSYRAYLLTWLQTARSQRSGNLGRLAKHAQVHATFLSQVLNGRKDLSAEQGILISEHLEHSALERDYFLTLVHLERAGNQSLEKYWNDKKNQLIAEKNNLARRFSPHSELSDTQRAIFYSSWIYSAIRIYSAVGDGQTLIGLADKFRLPISRVSEIMEFLVASGLCKQEQEHYKIGEAHIHVSNDSPFVIKHHLNWRMRAIHEFDRRQSDELFFTAPMSISGMDLAEKLNIVIREIVEIAKSSEAESLVCLNVDFFRPIG
jgi:uncharacterized protein (TIGR02147 family)